MPNAHNIDVVIDGFNMGSIADLLAADTRRLWADLHAGPTNYGADTLRLKLKKQMETLPYDPILKAQVDALLAEKRGWGRCDFINRLYQLVGDRYGVEVPHIEAKPRPK